jgi:hypothetical protein
MAAQIVLQIPLGEMPAGPPLYPSQPIFHPGHPDHGLPSSPGHPSQPIFHPGHPDHGLPSAPAHPGNRPPGSGNYPSGQPIPPESIATPLPEPPPEYADKTIVAVKRPNEPWTITAYDSGAGIDNSLPPAPAPK